MKIEKQDPIVFVVDDDESVRESLESLIRSVGMKVTTFASAHEFLAGWRPELPGCLVLDLRLPGVGGLELQTMMAEVKIGLPIIFISGHGDIKTSVRAMKAGAFEFLTKPFSDLDLLDAIYHAVERDQVGRQKQAELAEVSRCFELLTPREREVMDLVVSGLLNKQVADRLGVSEVTIKVHRGQVMQKMQAGSFAELVRMVERLKTA